MRHLSETKSSTSTAEDGRSSFRPIGTSRSIYLQCSGLLRAILHQRRAKGIEAIWSALYLHGFACHPPGNSIFIDDGLILEAYRRFVCRRGPVQQLRSDQGTNFVGAKNELEAALREMNQDKIRRELLKNGCDWFSWKVNAPHSSHMGGVWERQIRTVRSVLTGLLQNHASQLNDESLRTLMIEVEAIVNSRPIATDDLTDPDSLDVLTPNHLLTMKSSVILSPPGNFQRADVYSRKRWRRVQQLTDGFWQRWKKGYLQSLQVRQKWTSPKRNLQEGDIVVMKDDSVPRNLWKLARVAAAHPDEDGYVRKVKLAVADQSLDSNGARKKPSISYFDRPIHGLVLLMSRSEEDRGFPAEEPEEP